MSEIEGKLLVWDIFAMRAPLRTVKALEEPPSMVGIDEVTMHLMPLQFTRSLQRGVPDDANASDHTSAGGGS